MELEDKWSRLESIIRRVVREELANAKPKRCARIETDDSPIVEMIPINTGEWPARESFVKEMERVYQAVDVPLTLKEIRAWCIANPAKRKTQAGVKRFINAWCNREQNKG